jgi:ABC-2 type transport system permease protein
MGKIIDPLPMYTMWLRQMIRFFRMKARLVSSIMMPFLFLAFLGIPLGLLPSGSMPGIPEDMNFLDYLAPGILGMTLLFSSMMAGASVLWDKEFGFLKEVLVAPVNRLSIMLGRSLGGMTTSIIQGFMIIGISMLMGVNISSVSGLLLSIVFMVLICATFIGFGLILATQLGEMEGFMSIISMIQMPIFFASPAFLPLEMMPHWLKSIICLNPFTYGIDGLRGSLVGYSAFPLIHDFVILLVISIVLVILGSYCFEKMEAN